jgi:hypothetical protein
MKGISLNEKNMINIMTPNMELENFSRVYVKLINVLITAFT